LPGLDQFDQQRDLQLKHRVGAAKARRAWRYLPLVLAALAFSCRGGARVDELRRFPAPMSRATEPAAAAPARLPPISDEQRRKGHGECNPPDPLELGPYAMYRPLSIGRILVPQKGGHTADMGYDVLVHFHGSDAVRRILVQVTRGLVLVLVDKGNGGGGYARALKSGAAFPALRRSIEAELRHASGDPRAHIRHLAVSTWSAGEVAIDRLLQHEQAGIDAYVILDGLHAVWKRGRPHAPELDSLDPAFVERARVLSERAESGQAVFVLTHSAVDPVSYPSTTLTAHLLERQLQLTPKKLDPGADPFGQTSTIDRGALHIWSFAGKNEAAHCAQLFHIARVVSEILEPAWGTPQMDRSVPPTPLPDWEKRRRR
jgi:hypothetical protein